MWLDGEEEMRYCDLFFPSAGGWVFGYIEDGSIEFVVPPKRLYSHVILAQMRLKLGDQPT